MTATFWKDAAERVASSFVEAVIAAVISGALATGLNASTGHVLLVAGLTAAASTAKTVIASLVGGTVSPASLAPKKHNTGSHGYGLFLLVLIVVVLILVWVVSVIVH